MSTLMLYLAAVIALFVSFLKNKKKTKEGLKKGWKAFERILPQFFGVILLVGIMLAYLNPEVIGLMVGDQSGWYGVLLASLVGAITLIPGFIAFPTASLLLQNGAGLTQIAAFISSLMMVGIMTLPVETVYFGKKVALLRNLAAYLFSLLVALIISLVVVIK